jgi:hypothetical protein
MSVTSRRTALPLVLLALVALPLLGCAYRGDTNHAELAFAHVPAYGLPIAGSRDPNEEKVDATTTRAYRYAQLDRDTCEAELARRAIPFTRVDDARGVLAPIRLTGPVGGVTYRTGLTAKQRETSPNEVFDCRLVLALDDFSVILRAHDIDQVIHMSGWRPPAAKSWPAGKLGTRHDGALAIDAGWFVKKSGARLDVEKDFHGRIGSRTCGPGTGPAPATPEAMELRAIACEAAEAHLFQVELTPDYNWPHRNHFHLEVTPKVKWFLVH